MYSLCQMKYYFVWLTFVLLLSIMIVPKVHAQDGGIVDASSISNLDIVGGQFVTDPHKYPGTVLIFNLKEGKPWCGGTLIHPEWVLSAAHCFLSEADEEGRQWQNLFPSDVEVIIGVTDLNSTSGERIKVKSILPSKNYTDKTRAGDYALIRLSQPSSYPTANLAATGETFFAENGKSANAVGWGVQNPAHTIGPSLMKEITVPFVNWDTCINSLKGDFSSTELDGLSRELCFGALNSEVSTCHGDSGGPLFSLHSDGFDWIQIGITSYGTGSPTASPDIKAKYWCKSYSFYTNVSRYVGEIQQVLNNFGYQVIFTQTCSGYSEPNSVRAFEHADCKGRFEHYQYPLTISSPLSFQPKAFYIGTNRSVLIQDKSGNSHLCASRSLYNIRKDNFNPSNGIPIWNNVGRYTIYEGNTCGGQDTNQNGILDTFENCAPASVCAPPANPEPPATPEPPQDPGGSIDPNSLFVLYSEDGKNIYVYNVGSFNVPTNRYSKFTIPSGWSVKTYYDDNFSQNERCWNASVPKLQDHEEWVWRLESVRVYAYDACPKPATSSKVVLCTSHDATSGCWEFVPGYYSLPAFGLNDVFQSVASVPSGQSVLLMKEGGLRGTSECYNSRRAPLPSGQPWDLRNQVTDVIVFTGTSNCRPNNHAVVMYNGQNYGEYYWAMGTEFEKVINISDVGGIDRGYVNDSAESATIPAQMSARFFENDGAEGRSTACLTGEVSSFGELNNQISSMIMYPNTTCKLSVPAQPGQLYWSGWTSTTLDLFWSDRSDNEAGFNIYRWEGAVWKNVGQVGQNVTTWTDTGLHCSTEYYYTISAYNSGGESYRSNIISGITELCPSIEPPLLAAPLDMTVLQDKDVINFVITPTLQSVEYDFYVYGPNEQEYHSGWQNSNQYSLKLATGKYYWYGVVSNGDKSYAWSDWRQFVVTECPSVEPWKIPGDVNGDSDIDIYDYNMMLEVVGRTGCDGFHRADINQDGKVNETDAALFLQEFNKPPTEPSNLQITEITTRSIKISWQDNSYNETGFNLYYWSGNEFAYRGTLPANFSSFAHTDLECGASQFYKISAVNQNGESTLVGHIEGKTEPCPTGQLPNLCLEKTTEAVTFYEHWKCYGMAYRMYDQSEQATLEPPFDNFFSSIQVKPGFSARVYAEPNFAGPSRCFSSDLEDFYYTNITYEDEVTPLSDSVSSLKVFANNSCKETPGLNIPTNLTPDFSVKIGETYTIQWTPLVNASRYRIELVRISEPQSTWYVDIDSSSYTSSIELPGRYQWRVKAYLQSGGESEWSASSNFTVADAVISQNIYLPMIKR